GPDGWSGLLARLTGLSGLALPAGLLRGLQPPGAQQAALGTVRVTLGAGEPLHVGPPFRQEVLPTHGASHTGGVRLTDFWDRMRRQFGETYAESWARDFVIAELGHRTVVQA